MKLKKLLAILMALAMVAALFTGCASKTNEDPNAGAEEEDEENYETGDASLDDPRNQDGIGENELLVVSFGTSYNDSRRLTIGAIEDAMEAAFPDYSVRRGFTSQIIIDHVKSRDGEVIDNVGEALDRAVDNGVKNLFIQPTHLMDGLEYNDLVNEVAQYADAFDSVTIGYPLLTSDEDFQTVAQALVDATASYDDGKAGDYERVILRPMMIVAGDHANNDMAGDEEDSWKSAFEAAGYEVECVVEGLGQLEAIQNLIIAHVQAKIG